MKLWLVLLALGAAISLLAQPRLPNTRPSNQEQEHILNQVRTYAADYTRRLPDFICTQVTRRYMGTSLLGIRNQPEVITMRLSFFGQREEYKVLSVNGRPSTLTMDQLGGATSRGEFGTQLKMLFAPVSQAYFAWKRWATLRSHRMHVYSYRILRANSQWRVKYENRDSAAIGYRGLIYVDNDTEMVAKITAEAADIPATVPIVQAWTELDYDFVTGIRHYQCEGAFAAVALGDALAHRKIPIENRSRIPRVPQVRLRVEDLLRHARTTSQRENRRTGHQVTRASRKRFRAF